MTPRKHARWLAQQYDPFREDMPPAQIVPAPPPAPASSILKGMDVHHHKTVWYGLYTAKPDDPRGVTLAAALSAPLHQRTGIVS